MVPSFLTGKTGWTRYMFGCFACAPLASAASTRVLQSSMLGHDHVVINIDEQEVLLIQRWNEITGTTHPDNQAAGKQAHWDRPLVNKVHESLIESCLDAYHQARLKETAARHAGDWLFALPISSCGLRMGDETIRVVVGLRLGTTIFICIYLYINLYSAPSR